MVLIIIFRSIIFCKISTNEAGKCIRAGLFRQIRAGLFRQIRSFTLAIALNDQKFGN